MKDRTKINSRSRVATVVITAGIFVLSTLPMISAQETVDLGTADPFAILAGSAVTNTGPSLINGDIGVHPGTSVTGFEAATVNGEIHIADEVAEEAKVDLTAAYNDAAGQSPATSLATELGDQILTPDVYDSASGTFGLTGTLTLDAEGDPDGVWIFQMESTLITATDSSMVLVNGAQACNVFWKVGSSATLATGTNFKGNILAQASITMNNGATLDGRALARTEAVTLDDNVITIAECAANEEPVDEEPVDEEPVDEEPVDEEPVDEEPVDEEPVDEEPVDEEPVDEEPVDEEPVDEEPVEQPIDGPAAACATDLSASANADTSITLMWNSIEGAERYHIHRAVDGGALVLHDEVDGDVTDFIDMDTDVGATHLYEVRPVLNGVEDADCAQVEITAIPVFPTILAVVAATGIGIGGYAFMRRRS